MKNLASEKKIWIQLDHLAFILFALSGFFMIFFSVTAVQDWPYPWNRWPIIITCLAPLALALTLSERFTSPR